ncbi:unnamed protein product, partial [Prorocentrum cordatum]
RRGRGRGAALGAAAGRRALVVRGVPERPQGPRPPGRRAPVARGRGRALGATTQRGA